MAPSLNSLRSARPPRSKSVDREELDARWGDRSISAPTYQKPAAEPIVPAEWSSPATTLVDSSPDLSFNQDLSPVEVRRGERDTLTITIPLPWKRKSRARSESPGDAIASAGQQPRDPHESFVSPEESMSPVRVEAMKSQRNINQRRPQAGAAVRRQVPALQSPRNVDLKSPMFPLSPVSKDTQRSTRNVDLLTSELDAIALGQQIRFRRDLELTPIEIPCPEAVDAYQSRRSTKREHSRSPVVHTLTPMVGHFTPKDIQPTPASASDLQRRPSGNISTVTLNVRTGQHVTVDVLTPVEEGHERNGQTSPYTTSIEASPSSPTVPHIQTHSLSTIVVTPIEAVDDPRLSQHGYATNPTAALNSHPIPPAPRPRSTSRHDTERDGASSRNSARQSSSRNNGTTQHRVPHRGGNLSKTDGPPQEPNAGTRRKSSTQRRSPAATTTVPQRHAYRRSSDFLTTTRRVPAPISTANPQKAIYSAYFNRRSRSLEPTPSPRLTVDPMHSPADSVSSGSTDVDPASDEESLSSPKDPDKYYEARQAWKGGAGEGKKGFYANVVDDYRLIGKDVSTANHLENKRKTMLAKPEVTLKKIGTVGGDERVKIAGVDPDAVGGGQHMVPSSEELWG